MSRARQPVEVAIPASQMLPEPGLQTRSAIHDATDRVARRRKRVGVEVRRWEDGATEIDKDHADADGHTAQLCDTFGSTSKKVATAAVNALANLCTVSDAVDNNALNAALAIVGSVRSDDELEGALATQIAAAHVLSLRMLQKASAATQIELRDSYMSAATKLSRTMVAQIDALSRLRRGGEQNVIVKHVHVHEGGQAIVGNLARGAGGRIEKEGQPHARALPHTKMHGEDAVGGLLPGAGCVGEGAVPDARWR